MAHLSLTASCHLCNLPVSLIWNPKIFGRYRSTFAAAPAVLRLPTVEDEAALGAYASEGGGACEGEWLGGGGVLVGSM